MNRRLTVAVAVVVAVGVAAPSAPGGQEERDPHRRRDRLQGREVRQGQRALRARRTSRVKSGATVTLRNKGTDPAPHTISFVKKAFLPESFEFAAIGPLMAAHQVDEEDEEAPPGVIKVDDGAAAADQAAPLEVDSLGDDKQAGDSAVHRARREEDHVQGDRRRRAPSCRTTAPCTRGCRARSPSSSTPCCAGASSGRPGAGGHRAAGPRRRARARRAAGAATRHVWVAAVPATWNAVPNARDAIHGTQLRRRPRRRSRRSSTGATRRAGSSRCGSPTRAARASAGSRGR